MPEAPNIEKAVLKELSWDENGDPEEVSGGKELTVQFNPQTLQVGFSNQKAGGDQSGGSAMQHVGKGTTKLSLELLFDVTAPLADGTMQPEGDVRRITKEVAFFIMPKETDEEGKYVPPGVRFIWGTFLFEGVMDSMNETLELFSSDGKPLRATVAVALSRQEIQFRFNEAANRPASAGTQPQQQARAGDSVQQMAARQGRPQDWKAIASANNIENPRLLSAGTLVNVNLLSRA